MTKMETETNRKPGKKESTRKKEGAKKKQYSGKSGGAEKWKKEDKIEKEVHKKKKKVYGFISSDIYVPMKKKEMAAIMEVPKDQHALFDLVLQELVQEGKIECTESGKYQVKKTEYREGTYLATRQKFGFISVEDEEEDYFVSGRNSKGAMDGDKVQFEVKPAPSKDKRAEAKVVSIIERAFTEVVGVYQDNRTFGFVIPDNKKLNQDFFIEAGKNKGARDGQKVVAKIVDYGTKDRGPVAEVEEVLGNPDDKGVDVLSLAKSYGIPMEFPPEVLNQARRAAKPVSQQDIEWRKDLRDMDLVTIDGDDSKDLDDAVSLSFDGVNYHLGVHIADVSDYVQEGSVLDKEALKRGTSVYLADRVIPMLPVELSNGICSLNQGEDRLALSCLMKISPNGDILDHEICESVINSSARMTYTKVNNILTDPDCEERKEYARFVPMFLEMDKLAKILREKRKKRGSIDFDLPETQLVLDENGKCIDVKPHERNQATMLIEDFMLAANETVAEDFYWRGVPFVYRVHESPDMEKIEELRQLVAGFGYGFKTTQSKIHPRELQKLLEEITGMPEEPLVSRMTLRSMQRAKYATNSTSHFGLAAPYYCHFTSPIRRYPDLQIHRIIKEVLRGKDSQKRRQHYEKILPGVADDCSRLERRADEAERESDKMKIAEYMESQLGRQFDGIVSGVTDWGIYVELPNTAEGMVRLDSTMSPEDFHLGDPVRIVVTGADKELRTVDFEFVTEGQEKADGGHKAADGIQMGADGGRKGAGRVRKTGGQGSQKVAEEGSKDGSRHGQKVASNGKAAGTGSHPKPSKAAEQGSRKVEGEFSVSGKKAFSTGKARPESGKAAEGKGKAAGRPERAASLFGEKAAPGEKAAASGEKAAAEGEKTAESEKKKGANAARKFSLAALARALFQHKDKRGK